MPKFQLKHGTPIRDRLLHYREINESGCWIWTGYVDRTGYGKMVVNRKPKLTHRLAYKEFIGPIPERLLVCHSCDVKACFNPNHLFVGTAADNMRDCVQKGRIAAGEKNGQSVLTESDVRRIRQKLNEGILKEPITPKDFQVD